MTRTLIPKTIPVLRDSLIAEYAKTWQLKNYKGHNTHDGVAFTATIYCNSTRVGTVQQDGRGGSDDFSEVVAGGLDEMEKAARGYYAKLGDAEADGLEVLDQFVVDLLAYQDERRHAAKLVKKGAQVVAVLDCKPYKFSDDDEAVLFETTLIVALPRSDERPLLLDAKKERAGRIRILVSNAAPDRRLPAEVTP